MDLREEALEVGSCEDEALIDVRIGLPDRRKVVASRLRIVDDGRTHALAQVLDVAAGLASANLEGLGDLAAADAVAMVEFPDDVLETLALTHEKTLLWILSQQGPECPQNEEKDAVSSRTTVLSAGSEELGVAMLSKGVSHTLCGCCMSAMKVGTDISIMSCPSGMRTLTLTASIWPLASSSHWIVIVCF